MEKEELIAKMTERGYTQILSDKDYVMSFIHGMSIANFQKSKSLLGKEVWEPCF